MKKEELISIALGNIKCFYKAERIASEKILGNNYIAEGQIPDGEIKEYYSSLECIKTYKNGKIEGNLTVSDVGTNTILVNEKYSNGKLIETVNPNPQNKDAAAGITFSRSVSERVFYVNGKEVARQTLNDLDEIISSTGTIFTGIAKEFYQNGSLKKEVFFNEGMPQGQVKIYDTNGRLISIEHYKNGLKDGQITRFSFTKGILTEEKVNYAEGKLEGKRDIYGGNGKLLATESFKNNQLDGTKETFFDNGNTRSQAEYKNDKLHGARVFYYDNGNIAYKEEFNKGKLCGIRTGYYTNGKIFSQEYYKDDIPEGEKSIFDINGKLVSKELYRNGKLIKDNKN